MVTFGVLIVVVFLLLMAGLAMEKTNDNMVSGVFITICMIILIFTVVLERMDITGRYMKTFVSEAREYNDVVYRIVIDSVATNKRLDSLKLR